MNRVVQLGAAAVVILAVVGAITLRPGTGTIGADPTHSASSPPATASPSPSPTASTPTPSSGPSASPLVLRSGGSAQPLQAGTYRVDGFAVPVSLKLPAGWISNGFTPNDLVLHNDATNGFLALVVMAGVYPDPCHPAATPTPVQPGVDNLVNALSSMKKFVVTGRKPTSIGGMSGTSFTLTNSVDLAKDRCSQPDIVWIGRDKDGAPVLETPGGPDALSVIDVRGTTLLIGGPPDAIAGIDFGGASP